MYYNLLFFANSVIIGHHILEKSFCIEMLKDEFICGYKDKKKSGKFINISTSTLIVVGALIVTATQLDVLWTQLRVAGTG